MLQSGTTISQSIPDYTAQLNTMSLLRGKNIKSLFCFEENFEFYF
jgi:hypothetical protein